MQSQRFHSEGNESKWNLFHRCWWHARIKVLALGYIPSLSRSYRKFKKCLQDEFDLCLQLPVGEKERKERCNNYFGFCLIYNVVCHGLYGNAPELIAIKSNVELSYTLNV